MTQDLASGQIYPGRGKYVPKQEIRPIHIRCRDTTSVPSLHQAIGMTIAVAPFSDSRRGRRYIGHHMFAGRIAGYFASEPFPLEKAMMEFFSEALSHSGTQPIFVPNWNGEAEALGDLETDSILRVDIRRFWIEVATVGRKTRVKTLVYLDILLGVKEENRVFTQNMYVSKEMVENNFTAERVEDLINRTLTDVFDDWSEYMIGRN